MHMRTINIDSHVHGTLFVFMGEDSRLSYIQCEPILQSQIYYGLSAC